MFDIIEIFIKKIHTFKMHSLIGAIKCLEEFKPSVFFFINLVVWRQQISKKPTKQLKWTRIIGAKFRQHGSARRFHFMQSAFMIYVLLNIQTICKIYQKAWLSLTSAFMFLCLCNVPLDHSKPNNIIFILRGLPILLLITALICVECLVHKAQKNQPPGTEKLLD